MIAKLTRFIWKKAISRAAGKVAAFDGALGSASKGA
jgi:hypothetical protein